MRNPYHRYAETNLGCDSRENLVVALYECAIQAISAADRCTGAGDPVGRGKAVNHALEVLAELSASLDDTVDIALRLRELYSYSQTRLVEAHIEQSSAKLQEVAGLLTTLLGAWREIAAIARPTSHGVPAEKATAAFVSPVTPPAAVAYGRF
jgi:flagellar biosynthetic protein FliS